MSFEQRPSPQDYDAYYETYVSKVPAGNILTSLAEQTESALTLLRGVPADLHEHRYAPGKWTVKEVVGHLVDTEWVFTNRALRFARADTTPLPGVDQDVLIAGANFENRSLDSLLEELEHLRLANGALFASLSPEALDRRGVASDCPVSVRALIHIIVGHCEHHLGVLRERYL